MANKSHILIVDDTVANVKILIEMLSEEYELSVATSGSECLEAVVENPPDLILLDVMMPEMDGYVTCEWLKSNSNTRDIPVIFLTAKSEEKSEAKGFELGAVDYIIKPFSQTITMSRIKNHLELKMYRDKLEQMVKERTEQLIHADRLATMGTFSAGVAHEINNPTTFIRGNVQTLKLFWNRAKPILKKHHADDHTGQVETMLDEVEDIFESILTGGDRISTIVKSLKDYARGGTASVNTKKERCPIKMPIEDAVTLLKNRSEAKVTIETSVEDNVDIMADAQKLSQVFVNLLNNAIDAFDSNGGKIVIRAKQAGFKAEIKVIDNGSGMSEDIKRQIFTPFFTTKDKGDGTGLGMAIIESIICEHNGTISVESKPGKGTEFTITLPVCT